MVEVRDPLQPTEPPSYFREILLKSELSGLWGSLRLLIFLILGTFSASLAGQPKWTAVTLMIMVPTGVFMPIVWG
jgi:hypothetical protein